MDILFSILTIIFVALLIALTVTFGFALFIFIACVAFVTALLYYVRGWWIRWRFVQNATERERADIKIIEGVYEEIPRKDE